MHQYHSFLRHIEHAGVNKEDRTGTGTRSVFGYQMRFHLADGFPLLTTKKLYLKGIIHELLWFLDGDTNIAYLKDHGVTIWDEWADENGDLGRVYGAQWRSWKGADGKVIDQIKAVVESLQNNPDSRRHIVTAWNPAEVEDMALPPCHALFQFYVRDASFAERYMNYVGVKYKRGDMDENAIVRMSRKMDQAGIPTKVLDCQLYQRSADVFLGVPFNIASYALLTMMMAQVCKMIPGDFIWTGGDCHIYSNHEEQVKTLLARKVRELPRMKLNENVSDIFSFTYEDFRLEGYDPHPAISAPVAV